MITQSRTERPGGLTNHLSVLQYNNIICLQDVATSGGLNLIKRGNLHLNPSASAVSYRRVLKFCLQRLLNTPSNSVAKASLLLQHIGELGAKFESFALVIRGDQFAGALQL